MGCVNGVIRLNANSVRGWKMSVTEPRLVHLHPPSARGKLTRTAPAPNTYDYSIYIYIQNTWFVLVKHAVQVCIMYMSV